MQFAVKCPNLVGGDQQRTFDEARRAAEHRYRPHLSWAYSSLSASCFEIDILPTQYSKAQVGGKIKRQQCSSGG